MAGSMIKKPFQVKMFDLAQLPVHEKSQCKGLYSSF